MDGSHIPEECARRLREEKEAKVLQQDSYILAYRYRDYMEKYPLQSLQSGPQRFNDYYENLLANQEEPEPDATDDRSRAIWYAQEHFECYYEVRDIARITEWVEEIEPVVLDMTTLIDCIVRDTWQGSHEINSPMTSPMTVDLTAIAVFNTTHA